MDRRRNEEQAEAERQISRDLAARIRTGDVTAEGDAYLRYSAGMRQAMQRYRPSPCDAEDWLATTWEKALPKLRSGGIEHPEAMRAFLQSMAWRVAANVVRRRARRATHADTIVVEASVSEGSGPLQAAMLEEIIVCGRELVDALPTPRDREVLHRHCFDRADAQEVMNDLALDSRQFSKVLYRARKRLRSLGSQPNIQLVAP